MHNQKKFIAFFLSTLLLFAACKPASKLSKGGNSVSSETVSATAPAKAPSWAPKIFDYNPSRTQEFDLLHTKIEISFDWEKQWAYGKATLNLKPWFYQTDTLRLDAKGFDLKNIALLGNGSSKKLSFRYDSMMIHIALDKKYSRDEEIQVEIEYIARPNEITQEGSAAISEAKGLYFINPKGEEPNKPRQIWTQGETESNSCWFPTIDSPNERCTDEIFIRVEDKYVTLSNGKLISQKNNGDGTRTDHWKQELPHAPYLFMMAIGEYAIVKDKWRNIDVNYYVEKKYEASARANFGNTPEMLEFFSTRLGVPYPWEKYSQVVVRDFVSGAMENTSAVIHFSALQQTNREHIDKSMEGIVAHELFHHWFGDLVTCESWSNLPLNESFATYGEYLWDEYKYGKDMADELLSGNINSYIDESKTKREPLIRFFYKTREDMFDRHSYQKGGCILHMLRNLVGDDAFFTSLEVYLKKNAYTSVEIHKLRMAFEEVTGKDLNWFFNQWFMSAGHPELKVKYQYADGKLSVNVTQNQNLQYIPLFRFPVSIAAGSGTNYQSWNFEISSKDTTFFIPMNAEPEGMIFDADKILVATISENKNQKNWEWQLRNAKNFRQKEEAIRNLSFSIEKEEVASLFMEKLKDPYYGVRKLVAIQMQNYSGNNLEKYRAQLREIALKDPKSGVRVAALNSAIPLSLFSDENTTNLQEMSMINSVLMVAVKDSSYAVQNSALTRLVKSSPEEGKKIVAEMALNPDKENVATLSTVLMDNNPKEGMAFASKQFADMEPGMEKISLISLISKQIKSSDVDHKNTAIQFLQRVAENDGTWWIRLISVQNLMQNKSEPGVADFLKKLSETESNEMIKNMIQDKE